jgi:hypothetical protein
MMDIKAIGLLLERIFSPMNIARAAGKDGGLPAIALATD